MCYIKGMDEANKRNDEGQDQKAGDGVDANIDTQISPNPSQATRGGSPNPPDISGNLAENEYPQGAPKNNHVLKVEIVKDDELKPFETRMYILTVIGLAAAIVSAIYFRGQMLEMRTQNDHLYTQSQIDNAGASVSMMQTREQLIISREQAKTAQATVDQSHKSMIASQRPWLGITEDGKINIIVFEVIKASSVVGNSSPYLVHSVVSFNVENLGNTPAIRIAPPSIFIRLTNNGSRPNSWFNNLGCKAGETISQGKQATTTPVAVLMPKSKTALSSASYIGSDTRITFPAHAWMIGCFAYQDTLGGGLHHTRFLLHGIYDNGVIGQWEKWGSSAD